MKLPELKKLCNEATPPLWTCHTAYTDEGYSCLHVAGNKPATRADLDFCQAARTYMPKLIAIAEAALDVRYHGSDYFSGPMKRLKQALKVLEE